MTNSRNNTLDILRLLASFAVVFIHVPFYGKFGTAVDALARFAVPLFFFISGFFSCGTTQEKIKRRMRQILWLFIFSVVIYCAYSALRILITRSASQILPYFLEYLNPKKLLLLLAFNKPIYTEHLWYLPAILYVYIIFYFTSKRSFSDPAVFTVSLILMGAHVLLGEVLPIFGIAVPYYLVRNFAFLGIPFFGFGLLARKHQDKLLAIPNYLSVLFAVLGILTTLFSRYFIGKLEFFFGSALILLCLVSLVIKYRDAEYPAFLLSLTHCTTYIYILHPIVSSVVTEGYRLLSIDFDTSRFIQMVHPLVVCVFSTVAAFILNRITSGLKKAA